MDGWMDGWMEKREREDLKKERTEERKGQGNKKENICQEKGKIHILPWLLLGCIVYNFLLSFPFALAS